MAPNGPRSWGTRGGSVRVRGDGAQPRAPPCRGPSSARSRRDPPGHSDEATNLNSRSSGPAPEPSLADGDGLPGVPQRLVVAGPRPDRRAARPARCPAPPDTASCCSRGVLGSRPGRSTALLSECPACHGDPQRRSRGPSASPISVATDRGSPRRAAGRSPRPVRPVRICSSG